MQKRHRLNYFYFGFLFALLAFLHVFHVLLIEEGNVLNRSFYIVYAIGQTLFEMGALVLIGAWVADKFPTFVKAIFIVGTFLLLLMHLIDFPLMRIMDMSIWYGFSFIFAESFDNFIEMLKASNVQLATWLFLGVGAGVLILTSLVIFHLTEKLSARKPLYFSYRTASFFLIGVMGTLTLFDYQAAPFAMPENDRGFLKTLPWKTTFFTKAYPKWQLSSPFLPKPPEKWYQTALNQLELKPLHKPNIYLFIVESLRSDFITHENAPCLSQFRDEHLFSPYAVSAANATPLSWFSIFHSIYSFGWKERQPKEWSLGSLPLQLFKKAGYQIHVLSASQLLFYRMDQIIFGKNQSLVDDYRVLANEEALENHAYDAKCIDLLTEKMEAAEEGHFFIVFLEGTHFDYSFPPHLKLPMRPIVEAIDYVKITYSKADLEGIKNRYRHAIYHIDRQFDRFQKALQIHPRKNEAVIVFTSDHGEEFFEEGRIFHASNLNRAQTRVPIYYQLGEAKIRNLSLLTSHLDIFPTLLEHVFGKEAPIDWFDGESLFRLRQKPFAISTRFNASRTPYEFLITTEDEQLVARFENRSEIKHSKALEIVSRKNQNEQFIKTDINDLKSRYQTIFDQLFPSQ